MNTFKASQVAASQRPAGHHLKIFYSSLIIFQLLSLCATPSFSQLFRRQKQLQAQPQSQPQAPPPPPAVQTRATPQQDNVVAEMQVVCQSDAIVLMVNTNNPFNGMLYAKDAPGSSNCISEFHSSTNMTFRLPLKSCGTLSAEVDDGIEYFNTVVVQPHMRLMTNQGKGYHIRCKYQTRERTIANTHFNVSAAFLMQNQPQAANTPLLATASMPMCTMKIYRIDQDNVAESVKVGDKLVMVIEIDKQDMYGMRVTNCVVRDGLNKAEQLLINEQGCPVDETIMPKFEYENNSTRAAVAFKAHKFPHTSSVYYQCNVRLCINNGGCDQINCNQSAPPPQDALTGSGSSPSSVSMSASNTTSTGSGSTNATGRPKRFATSRRSSSIVEAKQDKVLEQPEQEGLPKPSELRASKGEGSDDEMSFDVYSGLYVSDISEMAESNTGDPQGQQVLPARRNGNTQPRSQDDMTQLASGSARDSEPCLTIGKASLLVMVASFASVALVLLIACQAGLVGGGGSGGSGRNLSSSSLAGRRHFQRSSQASSGADLAYSPSLTPHTHLSSGSSDRHTQSATSGYNSRTCASKNMSPLCYGLGLNY